MSLNLVTNDEDKLIMMPLNWVKWCRRSPDDFPGSGTLQPETTAKTMSSPTVRWVWYLLNSRCGQTSRSSSLNSRARAEHSFEEDSEEVARGVCNIGTKNSFKIQDGRPRFEHDLKEISQKSTEITKKTPNYVRKTGNCREIIEFWLKTGTQREGHARRERDNLKETQITRRTCFICRKLFVLCLF